jgi:hypothetical protein
MDVADTALVGGCERGATDRKQVSHSGRHEVMNLMSVNVRGPNRFADRRWSIPAECSALGTVPPSLSHESCAQMSYCLQKWKRADQSPKTHDKHFSMSFSAVSITCARLVFLTVSAKALYI